MPQLADDMDLDPHYPRFLQPEDTWEALQTINNSKPCAPSAEWMPIHGKTMWPHVRKLLLELLHRSRSRIPVSNHQAPCLMQPLRCDGGCNAPLARVNNRHRTPCSDPPANIGPPAANSVTTAVNDLSVGSDSRYGNFWKDCDVGFIRTAYRRALRDTTRRASPPSTSARLNATPCGQSTPTPFAASIVSSLVSKTLL